MSKHTVQDLERLKGQLVSIFWVSGIQMLTVFNLIFFMLGFNGREPAEGCTGAAVLRPERQKSGILLSHNPGYGFSYSALDDGLLAARRH